MTATPQAVIDYWFGAELNNQAVLDQRMQLWFGSDAQVDREIRQRFGDLPEALRQGQQWTGEGDDLTLLARVIVLDQFPRNLYRGRAQAFAYDSQARAVASAAIADGALERLHLVHAHFLLLPFEHSEDLADQDRSVALSEMLCARATPALKSWSQSFVKYAEQHRDLIRRFGRFPHRNSVLGRVDSDEERAFLASGGQRFGQ